MLVWFLPTLSISISLLFHPNACLPEHPASPCPEETSMAQSSQFDAGEDRVQVQFLYSSFHAINASLPINPFHASPLFLLRSSSIPMKINLGVHYNFLQTCWPTVEGNLLTHLLKEIWSRPVLSLSLSLTFSQTYEVHYFLFIKTFFFFVSE